MLLSSRLVKVVKISAQPHTIVKQICFPDGNVLFLSLFSISKNRMHNVVWGCVEILPIFIVCNLIDNSSQPMSEQEFLQLLGKKKGNESV